LFSDPQQVDPNIGIYPDFANSDTEISVAPAQAMAGRDEHRISQGRDHLAP
jgi:hypothetical protein